MRVEYKKVPGKNWGLHLEDCPQSVRDAVVGFVTHNNQWLNAPYVDICKKASPFIQSDSFGGFSRLSADDTGYLFIEFWSVPSRHAEFLTALLKECNLTLSPSLEQAPTCTSEN
jgi:hypothetical protein